MKIAFCKNYGAEFTALVEDTRFRSLGTRTECSCKLLIEESPSVSKGGKGELGDLNEMFPPSYFTSGDSMEKKNEGE